MVQDDTSRQVSGNLPLPVLTGAAIRDALEPDRVVGSEQVYEGAVWTVMRQSVDLGAAGTVVRDVVRHPGAAAVIALDERDRVVLVNQYRHPVGARLWEAPAGLVDREDEDPLQTAQRELAEEAGLRADLWFPLLTMALTPGGSDERIHLFLARGLSVADTEEFVPTGEESTMHSALVPLDDLVSAVLEGRIANATLVAGVLAVQRHRDEQWRGLPEPA